VFSIKLSTLPCDGLLTSHTTKPSTTAKPLYLKNIAVLLFKKERMCMFVKIKEKIEAYCKVEQYIPLRHQHKAVDLFSRGTPSKGNAYKIGLQQSVLGKQNLQLDFKKGNAIYLKF
jgi:hypothetical protein